MSCLGDRLREARDKKGLTISQAQKETHIQVNILKSLEDGSCDSVLSATYAKSFLRKYSEYLGLDSDVVLNEYKRLHPKTETVIVNKITEHTPSSADIAGVISVVRLILVGVIVIILMALVGGKMMTVLKKPNIPQRAVAVKPKASSSKIKSVKKVSREPSVVKKGMEASIPNNAQLKLLLKVNQNVLLRIKVDGALISDHVMTKGTAEVFTADNAINIYTASGDSIELILNGKPMGSPGKGILKNIEITRSGVKIK